MVNKHIVDRIQKRLRNFRKTSGQLRGNIHCKLLSGITSMIFSGIGGVRSFLFPPMKPVLQQSNWSLEIGCFRGREVGRRGAAISLLTEANQNGTVHRSIDLSSFLNGLTDDA